MPYAMAFQLMGFGTIYSLADFHSRATSSIPSAQIHGTLFLSACMRVGVPMHLTVEFIRQFLAFADDLGQIIAMSAAFL